MGCKLALLLSVELSVLIAAIFLLVYITKQQVSKWFTYSAVAIVITVLAMMLCSISCSICMRRCGGNRMEKECRFEEKRCNKMMMYKMQGGGCSEEMMMHRGNCCEKEEACEMKKECHEGKKECCEGKDGKVVREVVIDTLPKKTVIKK